MTVRQLGHALKRLLQTKKAMDVLRPYSIEEWGYGGCWILAAALKKLIGPKAKLYYVGSPMGVEHVVVRVGDLYLDQDGAQTASQLVKKLKLDDAFISPYGPEEEKEAEEGGTYCSMDAVDDVYALLAEYL